jgi:phage-related minor tail protein
MSPQDFAINQRREGKSAAQAAAALKQAYGVTAQEAAKLLKGAGYAADQVADAMKTVFNFTADQVQTVLNAVGYAANEVADAMKSVFGWIKKNPFAPLDPRRW